MKRIRALVYDRAYDDPDLAERRLASLVYDLAGTGKGRPEEQRRDDAKAAKRERTQAAVRPNVAYPAWLEPTPKMRRVAQVGAQMPTSLWFDSPAQLDCLVLSGRMTLIWKLLRYLIRHPEVAQANGCGEGTEWFDRWRKIYLGCRAACETIPLPPEPVNEPAEAVLPATPSATMTNPASKVTAGVAPVMTPTKAVLGNSRDKFAPSNGAPVSANPAKPGSASAAPVPASLPAEVAPPPISVTERPGQVASTGAVSPVSSSTPAGVVPAVPAPPPAAPLIPANDEVAGQDLAPSEGASDAAESTTETVSGDAKSTGGDTSLHAWKASRRRPAKPVDDPEGRR